MTSAAPACRKALTDATLKWPSRNRADDGIVGDARHQKNKSDHNLGNAVDVTHDPAAGCDGSVISALAIQDPRVTYVIWNRRIYSKERASEGWRPYKGSNPHNHHCHISIRAESRNDVRPWAWSPEAKGGSLPTPQPGAGAGAGSTPATPGAGSTPATPAPGSTPTVPGGKPVLGTPFPGVPLKRGSRGELVIRVQKRLAALHWDIATDGNFGAETETTVRGFQRRQELEVDGIVGRGTWRALFG